MKFLKVLLLAVAIFFAVPSFSQIPAEWKKLNEKSVVIDSSGMKYPTAIWQAMLLSGEYTVLPPKEGDEKKGVFLLIKLTDEMRSVVSKPKESSFFKTGTRLRNFSLKDINNKKYKLKELAGKVIVLNFWFINCPPCRKEIPDLNKVVEKYKANPDVIFLAIALDDYGNLKTFLSTNAFNYNIVADGRYDA